MSDVTKKECVGFGAEFIARMRGHKVSMGVSEPNLSVTAANLGCAGAGYGIMYAIKHIACKNTKFGQFSILPKGGK